MPSIAIIIPCYNEAKRLQIAAFLHFIGKHPDVQLYFVNDGSTDATQTVLKELQGQLNCITVVSMPKNKGKGEAIRKGMVQALAAYNYDYIGYLDADLSTSLEEFYRLYQKMLAKNKSIAFGSRIKKVDSVIERSYVRHLIGRTIATIIDKKFNLGCYDTQCGAKIFSSEILKQVIQQPFLTKWFFDIEIFMRLKKQHGELNALEIPLTLWQNAENSKLNILSFPVVMKEIFILLTKY